MTEDAEDKAKKVAALREELKKAREDLNVAKEAKDKQYNNLENAVKQQEMHAQAQELVQAKKKKRKKRMIQILKFTLKVAVAAYQTYRQGQGY
jgi:hypothetical protein